jgi:hypothetical protein
VTDFLDVGGVRLLVAAESWSEQQLDPGDLAANGDGLSMTGRPLESRASITRIWRGTGTRDGPAKDNIASAKRPAYWEMLRRWVEGWGQFYPTLAGVSASGLVLSGQANVSAGQITSGNFVTFIAVDKMRVRRGYQLGSKNGWTMGFKRTFIAGETQAAGVHWCVATGDSTASYNQGVSANPAGVTQYVDGAAASFNVGNLTQVSGSTSNFRVYGKKTDNTNSAITYSDLFFLPYQLPSNFVSQIWTNLINAGIAFPSLPRQKLTGQWLTNEDNTIEVIARVNNIRQRVGFLKGDSVQSNDLRELDFTFIEA